MPNWTGDFVISVYVHVLLLIHEIDYVNQSCAYILLYVDAADMGMCLFVIPTLALIMQ